MSTKIQIEHNGKGWIEIFKSKGMQAAVDAAGEKIAAQAGENFRYDQAQHSTFTAGGFVGADNYAGAIEEAEDKVLTKAVHK